MCNDYGTNQVYCSGTLLAGSNNVSMLSGTVFNLILGNNAHIKVDNEGAPFASGFNAFTLTAVPVPGAVWLFGSAIALLGWKRRRAS